MANHGGGGGGGVTVITGSPTVTVIDERSHSSGNPSTLSLHDAGAVTDPNVD